jgi:hypothetical protein
LRQRRELLFGSFFLLEKENDGKREGKRKRISFPEYWHTFCCSTCGMLLNRKVFPRIFRKEVRMISCSVFKKGVSFFFGSLFFLFTGFSLLLSDEPSSTSSPEGVTAPLLEKELPSSPPVFPQKEAGELKIDGYFFGDYYYFMNHFRDPGRGEHGVWLRRVYLNVRGRYGKVKSLVRLEMNSADNALVTKPVEDRLVPYLKNGEVEYGYMDGHSVVVGLVGTPTWWWVEDFWGYRWVEKVPVDLYRLGRAVDTGVGFLGKVGVVSYRGLFGSGKGVAPEDNKGKVGYGGVLVEVLGDWLYLWGEGEYGDDVGKKDDSHLLQGFVGLKEGGFRGGAQYAYYKRYGLPGAGATIVRVPSVFFVYGFGDVGVFLRYDRVIDPLRGGDKIVYLRLGDGYPVHFVLGGLDWVVTKQFRVSPNFEGVVFGKSVWGDRPSRPVYVGRMSFFVNF